MNTRKISRKRLLYLAPGALAVVLGACSSGGATQPPATLEVAEGDPFAAVEAGQGAVLTIGGRKVGVFKDEQGRVTQLSPKCPHQGCEVAWNAGDKVWECPCHGSRFAADGERLAGPAPGGLDPLA